MTRPIHTRAAVAAAALVVAAGALSAPAAARPTASVGFSPRVPTAGRTTTLTLSGRGFQSVRGGFGGIYVFFGVVRGRWQPSAGGASGLNYLYVADSEQKDNHGYQRFVAFPGDSTAYAANGGTLAADGTWHTTLVVPSSVIRVRGRSGSTTTIDCRVEQCGVITIGAHGVVNPHNETFTPVSFALPASAPAAQAPRSARPATRPATRAPAPSPHARPTTTPPATSSPPRSPSTPVGSPSTAASTAASSAASTSPAVAPSSIDAVPAAARRSSGDDTGAILGGVLGGVAFLLALGAGALWWRRARRS